MSKKDFGSILIIAGSSSMLGASALCSLAALRSGAGLVTAAVPEGLNLTLQKKISHCVMTLSLAQNKNQRFALKAYAQIKKIWENFDALAIGPGIGRDLSTQNFARRLIQECPKPLVVDADALFALAQNVSILIKAKGPRIVTPHTGEMSRLTGKNSKIIDADRRQAALSFAHLYRCVVVLKGQHSVVVSSDGAIYINRTGNVGMATAGSGDVLTGMIVAFLGQGMSAYEAAKYGVYYHGKAGDRAAVVKGKVSMIATDIIEHIRF